MVGWFEEQAATSKQVTTLILRRNVNIFSGIIRSVGFFAAFGLPLLV
jgi:hypothetical protein